MFEGIALLLRGAGLGRTWGAIAPRKQAVFAVRNAGFMQSDIMRQGLGLRDGERVVSIRLRSAASIRAHSWRRDCCII